MYFDHCLNQIEPLYKGGGRVYRKKRGGSELPPLRFMTDYAAFATGSTHRRLLRWPRLGRRNCENCPTSGKHVSSCLLPVFLSFFSDFCFVKQFYAHSRTIKSSILLSRARQGGYIKWKEITSGLYHRSIGRRALGNLFESIR